MVQAYYYHVLSIATYFLYIYFAKCLTTNKRQNNHCLLYDYRNSMNVRYDGEFPVNKNMEQIEKKNKTIWVELPYNLGDADITDKLPNIIPFKVHISFN